MKRKTKGLLNRSPFHYLLIRNRLENVSDGFSTQTRFFTTNTRKLLFAICSNTLFYEFFVSAIATPINNSAMSQSSSDSTPSSRPPYPRTQYSMSRAHVSLDPTATSSQQATEPLYNPHQVHSNYESTATNSSYIR